MTTKTQAVRAPHERSGRGPAAVKAKTKGSFPRMPAMILYAPLLPGKEEEWRRFVQEVIEERLPEYEQLRQHLGIRNESVWLARTTMGESVMAYLEVEAPERLAPALVSSKAPFDLWIKERLLEFHGHAFVHAPRRAVPELIFAHPQVSESRSLNFGEGPS